MTIPIKVEVGMFKLIFTMILFLIGVTLVVEGQERLIPRPNDNLIDSYFTDPLFDPWNSQAEIISYESQYYPGSSLFPVGNL
jgi:hypothetical protein